VALTTAAIPLWMQLSLMEECRGRVQRALAAIEAETDGDSRHEMRLCIALAVSLIFTRGFVPEIEAAGTKALEVAERLGDGEYQLRALSSLWSCYTDSGRDEVALTLAQRFQALALTRSDANECLVADRMLGSSQAWLGHLPDARRHIEHLLAHFVTPVQKWQILRFEVDQ
jgi:hypothetical protein